MTNHETWGLTLMIVACFASGLLILGYVNELRQQLEARIAKLEARDEARAKLDQHTHATATRNQDDQMRTMEGLAAMNDRIIEVEAICLAWEDKAPKGTPPKNTRQGPYPEGFAGR